MKNSLRERIHTNVLDEGIGTNEKSEEEQQINKIQQELRKVNCHILGLEKKSEQAKIIGTIQEYYRYKQEILNFTGERADLLTKIQILKGEVKEEDTDVYL